MIIQAIGQLDTLTSLDLSKNKFSGPGLIKLLRTLKNLKNLHTLSMSQINLQDESVNKLIELLRVMPQIRKLNLSNNTRVNRENFPRLIECLKDNQTHLTDLDLSKLNINSMACFADLAQLIKANKNLKYLSIVKVNANDDHGKLLVEPLSQSLNLEYLKFDFNHLTGDFVEKFSAGMQKINFSPVIAPSGIAGMLDRNASASLLASEREDNTISGAISRRSS